MKGTFSRSELFHVEVNESSTWSLFAVITLNIVPLILQIIHVPDFSFGGRTYQKITYHIRAKGDINLPLKDTRFSWFVPYNIQIPDTK